MAATSCHQLSWLAGKACWLAGCFPAGPAAHHRKKLGRDKTTIVAELDVVFQLNSVRNLIIKEDLISINLCWAFFWREKIVALNLIPCPQSGRSGKHHIFLLFLNLNQTIFYIEKATRRRRRRTPVAAGRWSPFSMQLPLTQKCEKEKREFAFIQTWGKKYLSLVVILLVMLQD